MERVTVDAKQPRRVRVEQAFPDGPKCVSAAALGIRKHYLGAQRSRKGSMVYRPVWQPKIKHDGQGAIPCVTVRGAEPVRSYVKQWPV